MRTRLGTSILGAVVSVAGMIASAPAAYAHPPGSHNRVVDAEPAVVYIETSVTAQIVLHDMGKPVFLQLRTYDEPPVATGNGVVVNESGTIVTASSVVTPDLNRARVYAANRMFADYYKVPVPGDPFARHTLANPVDNTNLQNCYETHEMYMKGATCVVSLTTKVRVFPFVTNPIAGGLPADVLRTAPGPGGVAVLAVNTSNSPTAALAPALGHAHAVSTIGFTGRPTATTNPVTADQHLNPAGATKLAASDFAKIQQTMNSRSAGMPVISADTGSVVGLISGASDGSIIPAERIASALQSLGIRPARSVADATFAEATAFYYDHHYTHAIPRLQAVLRLDPQNALAHQMLAVALAKRGTAADMSNMNMGGATTTTRPVRAQTSSSGGGVNGWLIALYVALGLLALAVVGAFLFGRRLTGRGVRIRRRREPPAPATSASVVLPDTPSAARGKDAALTVQRPRVPVPSPADATRSSPAAAGPVAAGTVAAGAVAHQRRASVASNANARASAAGRRFCTECGVQMSAHHRFCAMCGTAVD